MIIDICHLRKAEYVKKENRISQAADNKLINTGGISMSHEFVIKNIAVNSFIVHVEKNGKRGKLEEKDIGTGNHASISLEDTTQQLVIDDKQGEKYCYIGIQNLTNSSGFQIIKSEKKWTIQLSSGSLTPDPPTVNIDIGPDPFGPAPGSR
jgi:hypothetical protein